MTENKNLREETVEDTAARLEAEAAAEAARLEAEAAAAAETARREAEAAAARAAAEAQAAAEAEAAEAAQGGRGAGPCPTRRPLSPPHRASRRLPIVGAPEGA